MKVVSLFYVFFHDIFVKRQMFTSVIFLMNGSDLSNQPPIVPTSEIRRAKAFSCEHISTREPDSSFLGVEVVVYHVVDEVVVIVVFVVVDVGCVVGVAVVLFANVFSVVDDRC